MTYQLVKNNITKEINFVQYGNLTIPFDLANTDYQAFKTAILEQQPNALIDNGDSFSMSSNESILEDADGNKMTIDQAKEYVRTLP